MIAFCVFRANLPRLPLFTMDTLNGGTMRPTSHQARTIFSMLCLLFVSDCSTRDQACPIVQQVCVDGADHYTVTRACPWGDVEIQIPGACPAKP